MTLNFKFRKKTKEVKPKSFIREWSDAILFAVVAATLIRWTTVEAFVVPTSSMENTVLVGDYLFVSKFHYGTRTVRTPLQIPLTHQKIWGTEIPSFLPWIELPYYRLPGISEVKRGDVVVFNVPPVTMNKGVKYPIDLKTYYVKRCVALPGDKLEIRSGQIFINNEPQALPLHAKFSYLVEAKDEINKRNLVALGLDSEDYYYLGRSTDGKAIYRMLLTGESVEEIKSLPYISSIQKDYTRSENPDEGIFPKNKSDRWNGDNYGPILMPKKGMEISINDSTLAVYGEILSLYEGHKDILLKEDNMMLDGKNVEKYTFKQDYYFMMGDNRHNSLDSRYWGFVPEDHITGKALFIWMSLDGEADLFNKVRWNRIFSMIK
jgi:signal peptidase I